MKLSTVYPALAAVLVLSCEKAAPSEPAPTAEPIVFATVSAAEPKSPPPVEPVASAAPSAVEAPAPDEAPVAKTGSAANAPKPGVKPDTPAPQAEQRKVKTVRGSSASGDGFAVSIQAPSPVRSGESATASIVLSAKAPFHCNDKYPYKMALDAPSGVTYASQTVRGASVGEKSTTLGIPFTAAGKGKATIGGTFSFSVCTDDKCLIEKRALSVSIDVD